MIAPEIPSNEKERLKNLEEYQVLDTFTEVDFDYLTTLASQICQTPIALVSFIDEKRQWFKSRHGIDVTQTPRDLAFCAHAINVPNEVFVVNDARKDKRFFDNPVVASSPNMVFYAGVPLVSPEGYALGTLCVIDKEPKELTQEQTDSLKALGNQVIRLLELRKRNLQLTAVSEELQIKITDLTKAKQVAEESTKLKDVFLSNMSHEIRTPMNAIIGFTDLLLKRNLPEQENDYLKTIKTSGENLLRIINDILDISKIETNLIVFEEFPLSIREIFKSLGILFSQNAHEKGIDISLECQDNLPDLLLGDPTRFNQIIVNLVGNAIKFTPKGVVEVFAKTIKEDSFTCWVLFTVKDTGIGIPEEKQKHIFERFRQAEATITRNYGGTGLGLSISKQLIESQGGEITLKSVVDIGSIFSFTLPFKKPSESTKISQKTEKQIDPSKLSSLKILIAEDNPINIKFVLSLFSEYDIKADIAGNGRKAVEMLAGKKYDIVLMDIEMPEMNGYEATAAIRSELKNDVPIIAMTAHAMAGGKDKCLQAGMNDYLSKPINANILFEKIISNVQLKQNIDSSSREEKKLYNLTFLSTSMNGNKDVIRETIDIFIDQLPQDIAMLKEAVKNVEYKNIASAAHSMKSTVSIMDITAMQNILIEIETLGRTQQDIEKIKSFCASLYPLGERVIEEMRVERLNFV